MEIILTTEEIVEILHRWAREEYGVLNSSHWKDYEVPTGFVIEVEK